MAAAPQLTPPVEKRTNSFGRRQARAAQHQQQMTGGLAGGWASWDNVPPLTALPGQLGDRHQRPAETELWSAILRGAIEDLGHQNLALRDQAVLWFLYPNGGNPVSLRSCCEALGLDASRLRRRLLRWAGLR